MATDSLIARNIAIRASDALDVGSAGGDSESDGSNGEFEDHCGTERGLELPRGLWE